MCNDSCPFRKDNDCQIHLKAQTLDLINRQKAEIERLTEHNDLLMQRVEDLVYECDCEEQKAIKEFVNRLKEDCPAKLLVIHFDAIDNLVKEMVGEQ